MKHHVVVGLDGSQGARRALEWAVMKADTLGPVTPVMIYQVEPLGNSIGTPRLRGNVARVLREEAELLLAKAVEDFPGLADRAELVRGHPGPALVQASADADLLVVGSRGRSALAETLLGSIGSYCIKHAAVPVAVIPEKTELRPTIDEAVVGVDGSPNAAEALRWAIAHVAPGGRIVAAGCWTAPLYAEAPISPRALEANAAIRVSDSIADVLGKPGAGPPPKRPTIETRIEYGDPRQVLRELAETSELLVLGARGHRGIPYLLLGSVTTSLLHHPTAATVVVPARTEPAQPKGDHDHLEERDPNGR